MTGNDQISELSPQQERLITALLTHSTIAAAAEDAEISESTARRWLKLPQFLEVYRSAQQELFEESLSTLKVGFGEALNALRRNINDNAPGATQVRAAQIWLEQALSLHKISMAINPAQQGNQALDTSLMAYMTDEDIAKLEAIVVRARARKEEAERGQRQDE